ncbi:MAG: hypothetical protein V4556_07245 [Bacteroidota bacterium]
MKTNILLLLSLFITGKIFSQTGNVGIGTSTPIFPLTLEKNGIGFAQESGTIKPVRIGFYTDSTAGSAYVQTHSKHNLRFATANLSTQMLLDTLGNVGIGITAPAQRLDVNGAIKIGNTTSAVKGSIRYSQADSSLEVYDNTRWKSLINNFDKVGDVGSGYPMSFTSMTRNQLVLIPDLNYTVKKSGNYLITLAARGTGYAEFNNLNSFTDDRVDYEGELRITINGDPISSVFLNKNFFYSRNVPGNAGSNPPNIYFNDDGEKTTIQYLTAGTILSAYALVTQAVGANAPVQVQSWNMKAQVKYILLN